MTLELWRGDQGIRQSSGNPFTVTLSDGSIVIFSVRGYTVIDFLGDEVSRGSFVLAEDIEISTILSVTQNSSGGYDLIFGADFNTLPTIRRVELDADFQQSSAVTTVFSEFGGSGQGTLLAHGSLAVLHDTFDNGARTTSLTMIGADGTVDGTVQANTNSNASSLFHQVTSNGSVIFGTWLDVDAGKLRGRIFDLDGNALGAAFDITNGVGRDNRVQVDALSNGNFIVTFMQSDDNFENAEVSARLFNSSGTPLGNQFSITPGTSFSQTALDVVAQDDGGFLFLWTELNRGSLAGTFIAQYDNAGQAVGDPLELDGIGTTASITPYPDGRLLVTDTGTFTSFLIVDGRGGNLDGDEGDNILVGRAAGPSTINGFGGNDEFFGTDEDDTFFGGEGNDIFRSGRGNDQLSGGAGDDTYYLAEFNDTTIIENAGEGIDTVIAFDGFQLPDNVENAMLIEGESFAISPLTGNASDNVLTGNDAASNTLIGGGGNDTLSGLGRNDRLEGGSGNDTLLGGDGDDRLFGGADDDLIEGGEGDDIIQIGTGTDRAFGGAGNDGFEITALGELTANDVIDGGADDDFLIFDPSFTDIDLRPLQISGIEQFSVNGNGPSVNIQIALAQLTDLTSVFGFSNLIISEGGELPVSNLQRADAIVLSDLGNVVDLRGTGASVNRIVGGDGDDEIYAAPNFLRGTNGSIGVDISAGAGNDSIVGSTGGETIEGGDGADTIAGVSGRDNIDGGSNVDTVVFDGVAADFTIVQDRTGQFTINRTDGVADPTDEVANLTNVEFARFDDQTIRLRPGEGVSVNFDTADPGVYQDAMNAILDFDGN
ncbi:MAG: calcium-binding protein, partial [Pseudomonadota bacterium]|nr:calcium-binding protein [Pseudomonadota bacterium]